ncbi:carbohydrate ABC transporter permease [Jiangella asiatica]|uniref:Carbohydrate ABC transporter permease n=1 Tax=Jiangella asiatica TaxID=2530372 RepID=A0A4R5CJ04_9ACTN|nr:carbohydrate ABC transporter permease [Jiangella asiatica]TDE00202.1 carbohydrate ABC transporter permease [Jiangella asiatica]
MTSNTAQRRRPRRILAHGALVVGTVVMSYPLLWLLASSFKEDSKIFSSTGLIPNPVDLANYAEGWTGAGKSFTTFFTNSLVIGIVAVIGNVIFCSITAYAFARLDFRFRRFWFAMMLGTIMLPHHVTLIPQYSMFDYLGWVNTFLPLLVPKVMAVDAFFVFLLVQFIRTIPHELDDAARIDGCGPVRIFRHIIFPLLTPALATTAIFTFIWTYNDFFSQLIYLNDVDLFTVPLGLRMFLDATGESAWGPMLAMSAVALIPLFIVFLVFQRRIVQGIATTGLRG